MPHASSFDDRYDGDVLAGLSQRARRTPAPTPEVPAEPDLVVEDPQSGWVGAVVGCSEGQVRLEDRHGKVRAFPLGPGFLVDGEAVTLVRPRATGPTTRARTASGSFAVADQRARVARASRILVEGRHDAELVEKVWGDDLRVDGVVIELLEGVDHLVEELDRRQPGPGHRIGVLVDHLVPGSKESRIALEVERGPHREHVLVVGHPYVDVWQAVRPQRVGLAQWPAIPREIEFKRGLLAALGWPRDSQADIAHGWQRILGQVNSFADLEPAFLGRVEQLLDFVLEE